MPAKRHHYVPQSYLEYFVDRSKRPPMLLVYDKKGAAPRWQTPLNTAVQKHFYSFDLPDGTRTDMLERIFSVLEGQAKPILDRCQEPRAAVTRADVEAVAGFLAFTYTRVPGTVQAFLEAERALAYGTIKALADNPRRRSRLHRQP